MVTSSNFAHLVQTLNKEVLQEIADGIFAGDYVLFEACIYNTGAFAQYGSMDYCEQTETIAEANGNLFCSVEDFQRLCEETQALEF